MVNFADIGEFEGTVIKPTRTKKAPAAAAAAARGSVPIAAKEFLVHFPADNESVWISHSAHLWRRI